MVNILVPTDFSPLSKVAAQYAMRIAASMGGEVTLLNIVTFIEPTRATMRERVKSILADLMAAAKEDMNHFVPEVIKAAKVEVKVKIRITSGQSFPETIKSESKKAKSNLIVMGTKGASGLKKVVVGSNTSAVIEASTIPVLVVPELAQFKAFRNIVFATSGAMVDKELKALKPYFESFGGIVHLIHIAATAKEGSAMEPKLEAAAKKNAIDNLIIRVIVSRTVEAAIENYLTSVKADLITTFPKNHGLYDKLFDRSITRKLTFQSKIPLLAFRHR